MKTANVVLAACIALGTSAGMAQTGMVPHPTPVAGMPTGHAAQSQPASGQPVHPGMQAGMQAGKVAGEDQDFVKNAAIGGMFEVQSSELATTMSASPNVKQFAQMMISDHSQANQELMQLTGSKQIPTPRSLDAKHAKMLTKLAGQKGAAFDTAYGKAQAKAHMEAVALFKKESTSGTDPELKAFATKTLPTLQHHLQMAQQLPGASEAKAPKK